MAGLAAARALASFRLTPIVFEGAAQVGGKLRRSEVGGVMVDEGADSMLRRLPYGVDLATSAGLTTISPSTGAGVWTRGRVRPLPSGMVMGVPTALSSLSGVVSASGRARAALDLARPGEPVTADVSVGELVGRRLGREVVQRLVDPLLGGVYAGHADLLSLQMTLPQLWAALQTEGSLIKAARAARGTPSEGAVFAGLPGGLGLLPAAVAGELDVRAGSPVTALENTGHGWRVVTRDGKVDAHAVVLAVPAAAAAKLLRGHAPVEELASIGYASVGIVTLALDGPSPGQGTGYLIPAVDGRTSKAVTFSSRKWGMPEGQPAIVRASVGRFGDEADLRRDDEDLVQAVLIELASAVGPLPRLIDSRVTRWGGALPQYTVGHLDLVRRLRRALPHGVVVAGAAYDGVGVPAVIHSGQVAARAVAEGLR